MSSALDLDGSSKGVVLNGPCDWKQWISIIKKFATSHSLWEILDPAVKEGKPVLQQPVEPTFRLVNDEASDLVDLTSEEFRRLEFLHTQYRSKLQGYRDQVKALASLQQHIVKTIGNYYSTIAEEHDVAKQLALLQARVAPTDWALEREVLQRYRSTLQSPNRTKIEAWVTQWQKVLTEAKQLGLPDVQDLRSTQDFLQAVSSINAPFADYWVNKMEDEAALGKPNWKTAFPDGIKISEIFERAHRIKAANNSKGSFGAAFQGKGDKAEKKEDKPKWSSKKNDKGIPLCVCGKYHFFADCFYLIESARPEGWTADQMIEKKIKDILDSNPWAKTMTERAQQSKQKEKEKASDSSSGSSVKGTAFASLPPSPENIPPTPSTSFSTGTEVYPLRDSFILDSGSDTHICNDRSRFLDYSSLAEPEDLFAGDSQLQILGYGTVRMKLEEGGLFQLNEVAYVPNFHTNIASLDRFLAKGYNWNPASGLVSKDDEMIFHTRRLFRQPVIEYNQLSEVAPSSNFTSSSAPRPAQTADATLWHKRLGHLNSQALEHLVENTTGCKIKGPVTVDCESCSLGKGKRVVSRRSPQNKAPRPFWRIHIDIFSLHTSFNGKEAVLLIKDEFTSMIFIHILNDATQDSVMTALRSHEAMIKRQWDLNICIIHRDNDRALQTTYEVWVEERGIQDEPTAPYTSAQNGSAERSGGVIGTQARTMGIDAKLPSDLWPETWKAAVFLHNRSPMQNHGFKTPFQLLHQWLQDNNKDTGYQRTRPDITFLKAYGCRAYPLTKQALQSKHKKDLKTGPHAEIGYLVGYDSTNIFRIWIPSTSEVRRVRDVTFNESLFYDGNDKSSEPIPQRIEVRLPAHIEDESEYEEVATRMEDLELSPEDPSSTTQSQEDGSTIQVLPEPSDSSSSDDQDEFHDAQNPYPTPDLGPSEHSPLQPRRSSRQPKQRKLGTFMASSKSHFHNSFFLGREEKLHSRSLPPEPETFRELQTHRFGPQFKEAADTEWKSLQQRGTFKAIPRDQATGKPLPLTWVFKYKFDKHGFLAKFKARLCVRGDLQQLGDKDTYAATLAGRSFRILMAITAKFDLETRQLDAVNAFTNALLDEDEEVYVLFPDGYYRQGWVLRLVRALYGLRRSPLLWQKELTSAYKDLGLKPCPDEPCVFQNDWLTVFFFVDDIVFLYRKDNEDVADQMVAALKRKYAMTDQGELQWFLGIRVLRDRPSRKLWLCQDSYIERMVQRFGLRRLDRVKGAPFPCNEVRPHTGQASRDKIQLYQSKVGSLNYAAAITRADIAKPASKLAEFLNNPSELHSKLADHLIEYLYATRYLAIQFSGTSSLVGDLEETPQLDVQHHSDFQSASDAAFADDKETRKSSQGSILTLFGGPISWKAGKQDTVTTSSTEAELLALTHTAKETIATFRLFQQLSLKLDGIPTIQCDNLQTIRLVTQDIPRLRTALRHIDIHACWARQAFRQGLYKLVYTPTAQMMADGLTKALPNQKFKAFVQQLGLVDISTLLGM